MSAELHDLVGTLGMDEDHSVRMLGTECRDVLGLEALMDRAMALPEDQGRFFERPFVIAPELAARVPGHHVRRSPPELEARVASEMLVGKEKDLVGPWPGGRGVPGVERPPEHRPAVGRSAHGTPVPAYEGFQRRGGVHVGDRHHAVDVGHLGEGLPRLFHRVEIRHIGHRASGVQVGKQHLLVLGGENVGGFGHEMDSAEHHEVRIAPCRRDPRQTERVASGIGPAHHLVALVMVAQDHKAGSELHPSPNRSCRQVPRAWRSCSARGAPVASGAC